MAMLAAPRRKQKVINLRAKNSEWSNDTNKFGQRMLEKMGWSSGKGLGANENGMVEHVIARYKNDEKGLGFEDKNDQWTKHEDDFNALLANLSNGDKNEIKLHSGVSLEVKSKKSKARVHYHKFTRGKDLTRYSDKDLANIFGKKTLKNEPQVHKPIQMDNEIIEDTDLNTSEQLFTEKGSMEDYFKNKMAALKSKNLSISFNDEKNDYEPEYGFQGFSGAKESEDHQDVAFQGFSCYKTDNPVSNDIELSSEIVEPEIKKSMKKKKMKKLLEETSTLEAEIQESENTLVQSEKQIDWKENEPQPTKKKKSKRDKQPKPEITLEAEIQESENTLVQSEKQIDWKDNEPEPTKKKKSKRDKQPEPEIVSEMEKTKKKKSKMSDDTIEEDYHIPKKKKKRKNKNDES